jgi:hypothetical protein
VNVPAGVLRAALQRHWYARGGTDFELASLARVPDRRLRSIMNGGCESVTFATADRLVTAIGTDLWYVPVADGGLAEFYTTLQPARLADAARHVASEVATAVRRRSASEKTSGARRGNHDGVKPRRRTVMDANATLEHVRPARGQERHARPQGQARTLCTLDTSRWADAKVEDGEHVTCRWCSLRIMHGVTVPTPLAKLPAELQKAIKAEVRKQERAKQKASR